MGGLKVNINTATVNKFETLPLIGAGTAAAIVAEDQANHAAKQAVRSHWENVRKP